MYFFKIISFILLIGVFTKTHNMEEKKKLIPVPPLIALALKRVYLNYSSKLKNDPSAIEVYEKKKLNNNEKNFSYDPTKSKIKEFIKTSLNGLEYLSIISTHYTSKEQYPVEETLSFTPSQIEWLLLLPILKADQHTYLNMRHTLRWKNTLEESMQEYNSTVTTVKREKSHYTNINIILKIIQKNYETIRVMKPLITICTNGIRALSRLKNLQTLTLNHTSLSEMPIPSNNLTALNLNNNKIRILPSDLSNLSKLKTLRLNFNKITTISPAIGNLTQLVELELAGNQIITLPSEIDRLTNLTALAVDNNEIESIPAINHLTQIEILSLNDNRITNLSSLLSTINNTLQLNLYVSGNDIKEIPSDIYKHCSSLKGLDISNANIPALPLALFALTKLQTLLIKNNPIKTLPPEVGELKKLQLLDIRNTLIEYVPKEITNCSQLRSLIVGGNNASIKNSEIQFLSNLLPQKVKY